MVSVIIPVYNGEETVKDSVMSALCQSLSDIEVIVINDGSTDGTLSVLQSITDDRLRIITTENQGQGKARNKGIEVAKGDYIGFLDADDTVDAKMYETMYGVAREYDSDIVQCAINDITDDGVKVRPDIKNVNVEITNIAEYADKYYYTLMHTNEVCNKIFKKSFLDEYNLRFSDTREVYSEDLRFNLDALENIRRITFIADAFYNYNITPDGHCKKDPKARLFGIDRLYKESISKTKNGYLKKCIESIAVITLLQYAIPVIEDKETKRLITSKRMKSYMVGSMLYKRTIKHALLIGALVLLPYKWKKKIIKRHYSFTN